MEKLVQNVLAAEKAGGNVTLLVDQLNIACELLADAENIQRSDRSIDVTAKAENATKLAEQVNDDAIKLLNISVVSSQSSFLYSVVFSFFGSCIFVVVLVFTWKRFKRRFINKLLGMKPEVVEDTS
jgi:predicted PurR-regulated permease PerM